MIFFKSKKNLDFSKNKFLFMIHAETYIIQPQKKILNIIQNMPTVIYPKKGLLNH